MDLDPEHKKIMVILSTRLLVIYKTRQSIVNPNNISNDVKQIELLTKEWLNNNRYTWRIVEDVVDLVETCYANNKQVPRLLNKFTDLIFAAIIGTSELDNYQLN
jgi:hypothetical protein